MILFILMCYAGDFIDPQGEIKAHRKEVWGTNKPNTQTERFPVFVLQTFTVRDFQTQYDLK